MSEGPACSNCSAPFPDDVSDGDLCVVCEQPYTEDTDDVEEPDGSDDVETTDE